MRSRAQAVRHHGGLLRRHDRARVGLNMAVANATLSPEQRASLQSCWTVYTPDAQRTLTCRIAARLDGATARANNGPAWSAVDVVLITYADAISATRVRHR